MSIVSKEHYDLIAMFEKEFKGEGRMDKEAKDQWVRGYVYQDGTMNRLFLAYRRGAAYGKAMGA